MLYAVFLDRLAASWTAYIVRFDSRSLRPWCVMTSQETCGR